MEKNRACLECGTTIKGRIDKKFCSDYCRNAYNNKLNKDSKNLVRNINNRLRKNYRILDGFPLKDGKTRTTKTRLLDKGFDFEYITNLYTTKKGTTYYFIYDLGYLPLDNDYYMIVKRE
jgi:predicted nucleic acid-binding Zn ribbon protein